MGQLTTKAPPETHNGIIVRPSPLKTLVWEDDQGKVWVSYNSPGYLRQRHGFPEELLANISVVETLAAHSGE